MSTNADLLKELRIDRQAPQSEEPRRWPWIVLAVVVVLAVLAAAGWWLFGGERAVVVRTATVLPLSAGGSASASVLDATGYVVARRIATVSAKITGKVRDVRIEEGQRVAEGEIMATLDPIDADAQRSLSAAQLSAARSQLGAVQAQLAQAEAEATRLGSLVTQQLVSKSQYDQAIASRGSLRAQLVTAQRNIDVSADALAISDLGVDNTIVRAPFAGVVIAKAAQPGEIISPLSAGGGFTRTGIGTIVDMDSLEVEVDVSEAYIGKVQPRMPVEATLNAYPDWKMPAEVIAIIPTADRSKATVKVRIALKQKDPRIVPDMGVRVSFLDKPAPASATSAQPKGVLVPTAALVDRGGDAVFVVRDNLARLTRVQLGELRGDNRIVRSGVTAGDTVVVDPPPTLADGAAVRDAAATDGQ